MSRIMTIQRSLALLAGAVVLAGRSFEKNTVQDITGPVSGAIEAAARAAGFLVNPVAPDAVRLAPPLVLSAQEADEFVAALPGILDVAAEASVPS